jgi:nitrogen fixation protein FixH
MSAKSGVVMAVAHRRNRWSLFILLLVACFLVFTAWTLRLAAQGTSAVTDRNYYSHGLRYNQTLVEQQAAASLGWQPQSSLSGHQLSVVLQDRGRNPVTAAHGMLTLFDNLSAAAVQLPLEESTGGTYRVQLPGTLHGEHSAQIDFERDGARLVNRLLLSLP